MESQAQGEHPFTTDVKGGEVVDIRRIVDTRKVAGKGSIIID
jgi:hypothetical protein